MSSKREDEKNEKIIRGLMKLPPNRTCMNCNSLGPQFVCTNFWTFVCIICSGIHREFTHRVKSVSMAKFSAQEVQALQKGGNQNARDTFLKDWDTQLMKFPNNSNADKIREFIRNVYIDKKYAGERSLVTLSRDIEGNISSGSFGSNASSPDSFISASESFRSSSASFISASESFRSASTSELFRFISSDNDLENVTEDEKYYTGAQNTSTSTIPSPSQSSTSWHAKNQECFNVPIMQPITTPILSVDLFDDICQRPSYTTQSEENPFTVSPSENEEWATFDIHEPVGIFSQTNSGAVSMVPPGNKAPEATWASMHNSQWFSSHNSLTYGPLTSTSDQFHIDLQPWHNFDDSAENTSHTLYGSLPQNNQLHTPVYTAPACYDPYTRIEKSEDSFNYGLQRSTHDDMVLGHSLQPISTSRSSFAPSVLPQTIEVIHTRNSTNPFDFPDDLDSEAYNEFSDLSSLQATMSFPEVPTFLNGPPQHWLPQSSITQGELSHTKTQSPSYRIPNPPSQHPATSRSGNPFS